MFNNIFKSRRLQTDILCETLAILSITALFILFFTYYSNTQAILQNSEQQVKNASDVFIKRVSAVFSNAEILCNIFAPLFVDYHKQERNNIPEISAMLEGIKFNQELTSIYYGGKDGFFLQAISAEKLLQYPNNKQEKFLKNSTGTIKIIDAEIKDLNETWYYYDFHNSIFAQNISENHNEFDPRKRPWYKAVEKSLKTEWSDVYVFIATMTGKAGITVSSPIIDKDNNLIGVFGTDIDLKTLSKFLESVKLSNNSSTYILDDKNQVIANSENINTVKVKGTEFNLLKIEEIDNNLPQIANNFFSEKKTENIYFSFENEKYLASTLNFPKSFPKTWRIMIITPLNDFVGSINEKRKETFLYCLGIFILASCIMYLLARRISKPIIKLANEAQKIKNMELDDKIVIHSNIKEIQALTQSMISMKNSVHSFSKYVPKTLVLKLLQRKQDIRLGGRLKEVTLFFSDIAGFTTVSESLSPEKLVIHLSDYFEEMTKIISESNGTIDKYIGDAIMAFWGAPVADHLQAQHACHTALKCQKKLEELNIRWKNDGKPVFKTRIGLHIGDAIIGNMGSSDRMNYTAIGDSVNLCARLEALNKYYGTSIIISETIQERIKGKFLTRPLDMVAVKGKNKSVKIYELIAENSGESALLPSEEQINFCEIFQKAYSLYLTKRWEEALELFTHIDLHVRLNDVPVKSYIEKCKELIENPPSVDWDGSTRFDHK